MKEFVPLKTTFAEGRYSSTHSSVEVFYDGVLRSTFYVSPGESTRIVAWMAKLAAENVAWLAGRNAIIAALCRLDITSCSCADRLGTQCLPCSAKAALAAAVPEPGSEDTSE